MPDLEYVIVGAGPAGLQLGQLLAAGGQEYVILERAQAPGAFFARYPRHRQLISINKVHTGTDDPELNLRMDWNSLLSPDPALLFTRYTERYFPPADEMVRYLADYARAFDLNIRYGTEVTRIARDGEGFVVTERAGDTYHPARVVVATGVSRPYVPDIPGIGLIEQYATVSVEPKDFVDQRVLIIGKGNSALETADNLVETAAVIHVAGPSSMKLAWKTHYVGHLRAVNNNFLDTYQLKSQNAILDGQVRSIERAGDGYLVRFVFSRADEMVKELRYDRIIGCTGFRLDTSIFADGCRPALVHKDRFARLTPAYESVNVPGLYFAGTLTQERDFKKSTGGFIHGFRYGVRALSRILDRRHHDRPWPTRTVDATPAGLARAALDRANRTSALWQQFGVLGDVLNVAPDGTATYLEEVPVDYVPELGLAGSTFVLTLEYGPDHDKVDPFDISVARIAQDNAGQAHDAAYLHPVLRHYRDGGQNGGQVGVHHVAENLENEWNKPAAHVEPLVAFFARELAPVAVTR